MSLDGTVLESTHKELIGESFRDRKYYIVLMNDEEKVLSDLVLSKPNSEVILPLALLIKVNNKPVGNL